ncbi:MAG TPA: SAM-dependent methyltransferase [Pyrinomonadaceae bacterium]|nr:SAM-dependent methyltransferase [Pyrinomonadaceae bacterium]
MDEPIRQFIAELRQCLEAGSFVKLTLGNYKGDDESLQKITARPVKTKKGHRILFQYRSRTNDRVENFEAVEAVSKIEGYLISGFRTGHLFTTAKDFQLLIGKRSAKLTAAKPSHSSVKIAPHDREKNYLVDRHAYYLKALGITTDSGQVRNEARDKWKQINKFVEILGRLYDSSDLKDKPNLNIVDMGSGKGYLTFATYEYFAGRNASVNERGDRPDGYSTTITGVESRPYLVELCNQIARAGGYDGLKFIPSNIAEFEADRIDILIALHACDTATDDALFKGITANASIIIAAPCCHHEIKAQMQVPELLAGILKHSVMHERTAETITDGLRSLLLEREGYKTKLFEFVSTEHTPKNNMLVAVKSSRPTDRAAIQSQIDAVKQEFGIKSQRLDSLLRPNH